MNLWYMDCMQFSCSKSRYTVGLKFLIRFYTALNKSIDDSRLRPRVCNLAAPYDELRWIIVNNNRYVSDSKPVLCIWPIMWKHDVIHKSETTQCIAVLSNGLSHGGHSPQVTSTENFLKFEHVVFETREQTDRPTYRHTNDHGNTSHLSWGDQSRPNHNS